MFWFILWTLFIVAVVLSVPIVNMMENRKRRAAMGPVEQSYDEDSEGDMDEGGSEEGGFEEGAAEEAGEPIAEEGEGAFEEVGDDAFADFK